MADGLVVVGGCYAALHAAAAARSGGYDAPIRIITEESHAPYQRPPLSKGFLAGKTDATALPLKSEAFYRESAIELHRATRVTELDLAARRAVTADGRHFGYDRLVLATGSAPRPLPVPGAELNGVFLLRGLDDAVRLREGLAGVEALVIIGGGFIGLEIAAALASTGRRIAVIEAQPRLLARAATETLASHVEARHRRAGVVLHLGAMVEEIRGDASGRVSAVVTRDGTLHPAQAVVAGIGAAPRTELAEAAGLACGGGIIVDAFGRTADPGVFAAGECALHPNPHAGGEAIRLESVQHAQDHAKAIGLSIAGQPVRYASVPWFWSDQYEMKLQMAGLPGLAEHSVIRGDPAEGRFSLFHFRDGLLFAVESVSRPADHMVARRLLAARADLTPAEAADAGFDLASRLGPR